MSYTRNFEFRISPRSGQRAGKFINPTTGAAIVIGAPVKAVIASAVDTQLGLQPVALATGAQAPAKGSCGIGIFEYKNTEGYAGFDPELTTWSDLDTCPIGKAMQVVSGDAIKVMLRNTTASTFLNTRPYAGRIMVAGFGATPTIAVGDGLTPGTGDDVNGYWTKSGSAANNWLIITAIDVVRQELEAVLAF